MPKRKAKWQNGYIARNYERINFLVPKGEKSIIQSKRLCLFLAHPSLRPLREGGAAEASGKSTNAFLRRRAGRSGTPGKYCARKIKKSDNQEESQ